MKIKINLNDHLDGPQINQSRYVYSIFLNTWNLIKILYIQELSRLLEDVSKVLVSNYAKSIKDLENTAFLAKHSYKFSL